MLMMFFTSKISIVAYSLNPKLVSISDIHFNSKLKTVQMKLMKASSETSACLPYLLVSPAWLSGDLNRLSSLLQRQLPSFTQCTRVISIWGGWGWGPWWWWLYDDFDDQSSLTLWKCSLTIGILLGCCLFCRRLCICPWLPWKMYCYLFYLVFICSKNLMSVWLIIKMVNCKMRDQNFRCEQFI